MKRLGLLLLLLPLALSAQRADYQEQCNIIHQAYIDDPTQVANLMAMTQFYCDSLNPMCNYGLAIKYARQAEEQYLSKVGNRKYYKEMTALLKRHVTVDSIRILKLQVEQQAIRYLHSAPSLSHDELNDLGEAFRGCSEVTKAVEQRRLSDSYLEVQRQRSMPALRAFEQRYRGTEPAIEARRMLVQLADSLVRLAPSEQEVDNIVRGYEAYDAITRSAAKRKATLAYAEAAETHTEEGYRSFLSRHPAADEYDLALEQLDLLLATHFDALHSPRQLADFAHQNPDSPLAEQAMEQLRLWVSKKKDLTAAKIYFKEFPHDAEYGSLYRQYYLRHLEEGNADPILRFQQENPDFPFLSSIGEDLRQARTRDSLSNVLMEPYRESDFLEYARLLRSLEGKGLSMVALQRVMLPFVTARDWAGCNERMDYFMFTFEENMAPPYAALRAVINAPADKQFTATSELAPAYHILNAVRSPLDSKLYYTMKKGNATTVQTAAFDGRLWRNTGAVAFDNLNNEALCIYNLFDNGRKMLLGQRGDILIAELQNGTWHVVEIPPYPVNTDYEDYDAFMLPDGSGLLLASDRPNGQNLQRSHTPFHGDTALASDIYFIPRSLHGWGDPINLGLQVNTPFCDHAPLLSSDLKTLYFISDGHASLGYGDLFFCTRDDVNDWTSWSLPQNYGKLTNSGLNEASISFCPDERKLLLISNRAGRYAVYNVPTRHLPNTHNVDVSLSATTETLVDVVDLGNQCVINQLTLPGDGKETLLSLNQDKLYALQPHPQHARFSPSPVVNPRQGLRVELCDFTPSHAPAANIPLPLVRFEAGTADLSPSAQRELDNLAAYLVHHTDIDKVYLSVNVEGQDDQQCYDLSRTRALAIKRYLERQGVLPQRILISSYGNVNYLPEGRTPQAEVEILW